MYPNPQDVLPLPPRPDLEQYRKRAKDLVKACKSGEPAAFSAWAARWIDGLIATHGESQGQPGRDRIIQQVADFARDRMTAAACALTQAQFVLATAHGFASWEKLATHIDDVVGRSGPASVFEQAADAIITGDVTTLERLLRENPRLVQERSTREHRATLLHYVSANGVENYRQKTPANIVEIARMLLDAGAEVDAEANVYGGGATTLGLVVTSAHPRQAGVQNALADLLLDRGARIHDRMVRDCLANGCPEAAAHLVDRGASVDLQGAAGIGRSDVVARHLAAGAPPRSQLVDALIMASWYGQVDVVEQLLDAGLEPGARDERGDHQTALHIAAYAGHPRLVDLLVRRGAPVDVVDATYGTTPLVWAMHAWLAEDRKDEDAYKAIVRALVAAGAAVRAEWLDDERITRDGELHALLRRATKP